MSCRIYQKIFIQIYETVLSQETIKQLSPEQLKQIEGIVKLSMQIEKVIVVKGEHADMKQDPCLTS